MLGVVNTPSLTSGRPTDQGHGEQGKVARSATPKPVVDPCTTRSAIEVSTPWAECERVGPAQLEADPHDEVHALRPYNLPHAEPPTTRAQGCGCRRPPGDPRAVRKERKTSLAGVNAVSSLVDRQFVLLCMAGTRHRHGEPWYIWAKAWCAGLACPAEPGPNGRVDRCALCS
jgi:hypothetical protein